MRTTPFGLLLAIFAPALGSVSVACSSEPAPGPVVGAPTNTAIVGRDSGPGPVTPGPDAAATCKLAAPVADPDSGVGAACNACVESNCCAEINACTESLACVQTDQCVSKCFDTGGGQQAVQQCQVACLDQRPEAKPTFLSAQGCVAQKCVSSCQ